MRVITDNEIERAKWNALLLTGSFVSPFQTPSFYDFYNSVKGYSARVFATAEGDRLTSLVVVTIQSGSGIKCFFSRRGIIYGGPLVSDGEAGQLALMVLLQAVNEELKNKVIYIETRNQGDYSRYNEQFTSVNWRYASHLNYIISLKGRSPEEVHGAIKPNKRRQIRLSVKAGVKHRQAESIDEVFNVYSILKDLYKKRVKLPLPGFDYFEKLYRSDIGKIFVVIFDEKIVGGVFCFYYPGTSICTMYYCGLSNIDRNVFPTHLGILATIDFGFQNNLQFVDLMGAGKPDDKYGVRIFKSEFGGTLQAHGRYFRVYNHFLFNLGKTAISLYRAVSKGKNL